MQIPSGGGKPAVVTKNANHIISFATSLGAEATKTFFLGGSKTAIPDFVQSNIFGYDLQSLSKQGSLLAGKAFKSLSSFCVPSATGGDIVCTAATFFSLATSVLSVSYIANSSR